MSDSWRCAWACVPATCEYAMHGLSIRLKASMSLQGSVSTLHVEEIRLVLSASLYSTVVSYLLGSPSPSAIHLSSVRVKLRDPTKTSSPKEEASVSPSSPVTPESWQPPLIPPLLLRCLPGLTIKFELNVELEGIGLRMQLPSVNLACKVPLGPASGGGAGLSVTLTQLPLTLALIPGNGPDSGADATSVNNRKPSGVSAPSPQDTELLSCHGLHLELELNTNRWVMLFCAVFGGIS